MSQGKRLSAQLVHVKVVGKVRNGIQESVEFQLHGFVSFSFHHFTCERGKEGGREEEREGKRERDREEGREMKMKRFHCVTVRVPVVK